MTRAAILVAVVAAFAVTTRAQTDPLREMFDKHRWFELRDATAGRNAAPLYRGAVAVAFNLVIEAEPQLRQAIREAKTPAAANEAREILLNLYMRLGRSAAMLRLLDEAVVADARRSPVRCRRTASCCPPESTDTTSNGSWTRRSAMRRCRRAKPAGLA